MVTNSYDSSVFLWIELFSLTVSAIVAVIITFLIQNYLNKPKIRCRIFQLIGGKLVGTAPTKSLWSIYILLTNQHRSPIYVLDYALWLDFGEGYVKMDRVYNIHTAAGFPDSLTTTYDDGRVVQITDLKHRLIYTQNKPVRFGDFLHGFAMFVGDESLWGKRPNRIKLTCEDVLGRKHTTEIGPSQYLNSYLFDEIVQSRVEKV